MPRRPVNGNPALPRRLLVIANPISGGGRGRTTAPALAACLARAGVHAEVFFTGAAGDAERRARAAGGEPWDGLVACGGDGTVHEILNGMPDPGRPLGVLPVGTANVLALELGLPRRGEQVAALLASGSVRELAIGTANGRRFLLFCGAGVDGAVVHRLAAVRTGTLGKHKWLWPILHTVRHWPRFTLRATFADGSVLDGLSSVLVTRVRNYGGVVHLPAEVDVDDGRLFVLCFRARSRTAWIGLGLAAACRRLRPGRGFELRATQGVRIDGEAPMQLDGDAAGTAPVDVRLLPVRARVFAPGRR